MGNPHKGEVEFTVGDKSYVLYFSINAMCELEDSLGTGIVELANSLADAGKLKLKDVRAVFWAGLRDHHEALTLTDAGRIMSDMGVPKAMELVAKAFSLAFPEVDTSRPLPVAPVRERASTGKRH